MPWGGRQKITADVHLKSEGGAFSALSSYIRYARMASTDPRPAGNCGLHLFRLPSFSGSEDYRFQTCRQSYCRWSSIRRSLSFVPG